MPPFLLNQLICDASCYDVTRDRVRFLVAGGDRDHLALTVFFSGALRMAGRINNDMIILLDNLFAI